MKSFEPFPSTQTEDEPPRIPPLYGVPFNRRQFLKTFVGGLAVLWLIDADVLAQAESGNAGRRQDRRPKDLAAWLQINADGTVTAFTGKAEVGQNIRTSLTQAIAEELPIPLASISLVMADTSLVPWDAGTFGSRTTPVMNLQLRRVAATAREGLLDLAVKKWNVPRNSLVVADGKISTRPDGGEARVIGFGELTGGEKLVLDVSDDIPLKPASAWTVAGVSIPKVDARKFVTGEHVYTTDIVDAKRIERSGARRNDGSALAGMLHGRVLRPTGFASTLVSLHTSAVDAMTDVTLVRDGNFVGVAAPTEHQASLAIAALRAEWKTPAQISESELFQHLRSTGSNRAAATPNESSEPVNLHQTYTVAYIAHAPLEPRAAVAEWQGDRLTVWTGSQRPFGVREELASTFQIPEENVRVIVPDTGSGYGGKHTGEAAIEAARLARWSARPVKLVWTREEEFTWAYFRPAGVIDLTSAVDRDGHITRWEHHNYNSGNAGIGALYHIPGAITKFHESESPLRQGSYRALASTANHFARETHIDELADLQKLDPLEFRLRNLRDERARAVLEAAAKAFGWSWNPGVKVSGIGIGIAAGSEKGGYLATAAQVEIDAETGHVAVRRVVQAFECGAIVNPDHLKNQVEGAIVQGLGGALFEAIRFGEGRILNPRFSLYRVPRFSDVPSIRVILLDRKDLPSAGAGEAPIVGIAPAIGNALFNATGERLRSLPLVPHGVKKAEPDQRRPS
jgi:isoquinoline 1-oxidoreductase